MSDKEKVNLNIRFSSEQEINHYTTISYKLNEKEVIKSGGVICIGSYCRCRDKKNCECVNNLEINYFKFRRF